MGRTILACHPPGGAPHSGSDHYPTRRRGTWENAAGWGVGEEAGEGGKEVFTLSVRRRRGDASGS